MEKTEVIEKTFSFEKNGNVNEVYTLQNANGLKMQVLTYGARIISLDVPDKNGKFFDVIVGPKNPEQYYDVKDYYGATVGRFANRIAKGKFVLNGKEYQLDINQGEHSLHGGNTANFDRAIWKAEIKGDKLELTHFSPDGAGGYPGNMKVTVTYGLTDDNGVEIEYNAVCDKDTICNLTNHAFFCLSETKRVADHILMIKAQGITVCDRTLIPTGEIRPIAGTAFCFNPPKPVGADFESDEPMIEKSHGYDLNYCLDRETKDGLEKCAYLYDFASGRCMSVYTTLPGLQIYARQPRSNELANMGYPEACSICLETQFYPDTPNHPNFPSAELKAGQEYKHKTVYKFTIE